MTAAPIRDRELRDLVEALDGAAEILELIGFQDFSANTLSLPLHECFTVKDALRRAGDFLAELRFCGGRP
jgi:hypothetical protein